jgi:hypothetical protein
MERDKRFQHAQYLIGFLHNYGMLEPDSQEVSICCSGSVRIRTYALVLASASQFLRKVLLENADEEFCLVLPDLDPDHLDIFLR